MAHSAIACAATRAVVCSFGAHSGPARGGSSMKSIRCKGITNPRFLFSTTTTGRGRVGSWPCASSGDAPDTNCSNNPPGKTKASLKATLVELEAAMAHAVANEDFGKAAQLRDELKTLRASDSLHVAQQALDDAIAEERYEDCARLRDEVHELTPKRTKSSSTKVTQGVRVDIRSRYVRERSDVAKDEYLFSYKVTFTNESSTVVQLINRKWVIEDDNEHVETVEGPGVIGQQPVLLPGQKFEYQSACPLRTPHGKMFGHFGFVKLITQTAEEYADANAEGGETPDEVLNVNERDVESSSGVTFLKQPSDAEFTVLVGVFGLNSEE